MPNDFDRLIGTLKRLKVVGTLKTLAPVPRPRRYIRPRLEGSVVDRPRVRLPSLEHALRRRNQARWTYRCEVCGVTWIGRVLDTKDVPASVLATLAVIRVPCPVCWALAWASGDQATRAAWSRVPAWLRPRAR